MCRNNKAMNWQEVTFQCYQIKPFKINHKNGKVFGIAKLDF